MQNLAGRVAVITGGASGIGAATVQLSPAKVRNTGKRRLGSCSGLGRGRSLRLRREVRPHAYDKAQIPFDFKPTVHVG